MGPYRVVARLLGWRKIRFIREKFVSSSEGTSEIAGQIHERGNYVLQGRISPRSITAQNGLFIFKPFLMWVHLSFPSIQQRPPDGEPPYGRTFGPQKTLWCMPPDPQLTFYWHMAVLSHFQSCPTLCDPMDCIPPGSSVHGILQARIMERVAISFSRRSSQPRDWTCVSYNSCIGRQVLYC